MNRERVVSFREHRVWCSLFAGAARCDCGQLDAVALVEWWAGQARAGQERRAS